MVPEQPTPEWPLARSTDPTTSHLAAERLTATGERDRQRAIVLALVLDHPGKTSLELGELSTELDRYQVARRLGDLANAGLLRKGSSRLSMVGPVKGRREAVTWWLSVRQPPTGNGQATLF